jgi:hypothetical protein
VEDDPESDWLDASSSWRVIDGRLRRQIGRKVTEQERQESHCIPYTIYYIHTV